MKGKGVLIEKYAVNNEEETLSIENFINFLCVIKMQEKNYQLNTATSVSWYLKN
jgi:hypothetical protein